MPVQAQQTATKIATVTRRTFRSTLTLPISVAPSNEVTIVAPVSGIVDRVMVDINSRVKKGQVIATIATRSKPFPVVAPIDGVVIERKASPGAYVREGDATLFEIIEYSNVIFQLQVPEAAFPRLAPGQKLEARFEAYPNRIYAALLRTVVPRVDAASHTVLALADCANPDGALIIGMHGQGSLVLGIRENVLAVATNAVQRDGAGAWVLRVDHAGPQRTAVQLGWEEGDQVEVIAGLNERDLVYLLGSPAAIEAHSVSCRMPLALLISALPLPLVARLIVPPDLVT